MYFTKPRRTSLFSMARVRSFQSIPEVLDVVVRSKRGQTPFLSGVGSYQRKQHDDALQSGFHFACANSSDTRRCNKVLSVIVFCLNKRNSWSKRVWVYASCCAYACVASGNHGQDVAMTTALVIVSQWSLTLDTIQLCLVLAQWNCKL